MEKGEWRNAKSDGKRMRAVKSSTASLENVAKVYHFQDSHASMCFVVIRQMEEWTYGNMGIPLIWFASAIPLLTEVYIRMTLA
jgi:hypothetical protein